ncbi:YciI family protein [Comamonadaceae bacterium G21597-S1]|nr:YciI family protein [Comamonadaceae bacterium G21597-S1]
MSYLLLIVEPRDQRAERGVEAGKQVYAEMAAFAAELQQRGVLLGVESLASDAKGTRVQVRDGRVRALDGPFTESKEMVGGFFLLNCTDRAQALTIAQQCPAAQWATVEVREVGPCFE